MTAAVLALTVGLGVALWEADVARGKTKDAAAGEAEQKRIAELKAEAVTKPEAEVADQLRKTQQAAEGLQKETAQLTESRRLHDLGRLREAEAAWDKTSARLARDKLAEVAPENRCVAWGILNRRFEGGEFTLWVTRRVCRAWGFGPDGRRIVTGSYDKTARVWDASTGKHLPGEPIPDTLAAGNVLPDGRVVVRQGNGAVIVDPRIDPALVARRWFQARSYPHQHAALAERYNDPFAAAVQRSLEQRARGLLAVEDLDFDKAQKHYLAALLLEPKPYQWPEVASPPRPAK